MSLLNETDDPALRSWIECANAADMDFPIQNLPFGAFVRSAVEERNLRTPAPEAKQKQSSCDPQGRVR